MWKEIIEIFYFFLTTIVPKIKVTRLHEERLAMKTISNALTKLRYDLKADMVHLFLRHNGGDYINGYSYYRMTCVYEQSLNGDSLLLLNQNIAVSVYPELEEELINNGVHYREDTYHNPTGCRFTNMSAINGYQSFLVVAIKGNYDNIIGHYVLYWTQETAITEAYKDAALTYAAICSSVLSQNTKAKAILKALKKALVNKEKV